MLLALVNTTACHYGRERRRHHLLHTDNLGVYSTFYVDTYVHTKRDSARRDHQREQKQTEKEVTRDRMPRALMYAAICG